jgi:hypothetical protein
MASSGIAMDVHFCMGEKDNVSFYSKSSEKCGKCGMTEKKDGCCHNEPQFVKLAIDQKHTVVPDFDFSTFVLLTLPCFSAYAEALYTVNSGAVSINDPPDLIQPDRNILYSVFRI